MAQSWRLNIKSVDKTERTSTSTDINYAIAIKAPKGQKTFRLFEKGETQKVLNIFGYPCADYPAIQDLLDIVNTTSVYACAPYAVSGTNKFGGVYITSNGVYSLPYGLSSCSGVVASDIATQFTFGSFTQDGSTTEYTITGNNQDFDTANLVVSVGGTDNTLTYDSVSDSWSNASITVTRTVSSNKLTLTVTFNTASASGTSCIIKMNVNTTNLKCVLMCPNCEENDTVIDITSSEDIDEAFDVQLYRYNPISSEYIEDGSSITVGLSTSAKDAYNQSIYIGNTFDEDNLYLVANVIDDDLSGVTLSATEVPLNGGYRDDETVTDSLLATAYEELQDTDAYNVKLVVSSYASSEIVSMFETLSNNYQKYCQFIYPTANIEASTIIESSTPAQYAQNVTSNSNLACYVLSWGIHTDTYQGNNFLCSNMGLIASKWYNCLSQGYGVPAWIDENGIGGLLGSSITKLSKKATQTQLKKLNKLGYCPVVYDYEQGPMIEGWKTRQIKNTVYSDIGPCITRNTILYLISKSLPNRIGKFIDEDSYSKVRNMLNTVMSTYSNAFEDYEYKCDNENNTSVTKQNQELIVQLAVIYKAYAQTITFTLTATDFGTDVSEALA